MPYSRTDRAVPSDMADDAFLSLREVAALDGTSIDTVRRAVRSGNLPVTRLSARRLGIRRSDYRRARTPQATD
jgi:predicted site-specific integrase-resolvase